MTGALSFVILNSHRVKKLIIASFVISASTSIGVPEDVSISSSVLPWTFKASTPKQVSRPKKKQFSNNSVLNDVLNETAQSEEWKTMGGTKFTSERMNELVGGQYGDMMSETPQQVPSSDPMAQFLNNDYREVLKRTEEKQKQKYGK